MGILLLLAALAPSLPILMARLTGCQVYNVVSGSMEPLIPVGSAVYVEPVKPAEIGVGEVIAFYSGGSVVVHRVVENRAAQKEFVTKGDANEGADIRAAGYTEVVGRVSRHVSGLGALLALYTSSGGKACAVGLAGCGAILCLLAGKLRDRRAA